MDVFSFILDFSNIRKINCKDLKPDFDTVQHVWMNYLSNKEDFIEDYKLLGFPLTNNIDYIFNKFESEQDFANKINENLFFSNNINAINNINSEVFLIRNNEDSNVNINLRYNHDLSNERNKIINENNFQKLNNILFIYIDSLSRSHFFRKMKSVSHFFEKFNNKKNNTSNYESFQFLKYQTFKNDYYTSSIQTMLYNKTKNQNKNIQNIHILSFLKRNGYITGQSANVCSKEFFSYDFEKETNFFKNTLLEEYDHENIAMFCDPFYFDDSKDKNPDSKYVKGINSSIKRCLYGKNSFEYVLEYGYQFWSKYKNNKRFLRLGFFDGNEKTGEVIKYLDSYLHDFLYKLYKENYLKDTILFIVSGQGNIYTDFFNNDDFEDFLIEKYIGSLFIFVDKNNFSENNLKHIRINQQNMVTPYDIKETLVSIMYNNFPDETKKEEIKIEEFSQKGKSLFNYINSKERNCEKYKQTTEEVCRCHNFQ